MSELTTGFNFASLMMTLDTQLRTWKGDAEGLFYTKLMKWMLAAAIPDRKKYSGFCSGNIFLPASAFPDKHTHNSISARLLLTKDIDGKVLEGNFTQRKRQ